MTLVVVWTFKSETPLSKTIICPRWHPWKLFWKMLKQYPDVMYFHYFFVKFNMFFIWTLQSCTVIHYYRVHSCYCRAFEYQLAARFSAACFSVVLPPHPAERGIEGRSRREHARLRLLALRNMTWRTITYITHPWNFECNFNLIGFEF